LRADLQRLLGQLGWRLGRRATKFVAYFQLVDACTQRGCPVCRCLREQTFRSLDALLYELRGFIDKHDYRARARFTDEEAASWTAALEFLARPSRSEPASPPAAPREEPETAERLRERLEALAVEKGQLERRLADFTRQSGAAGCRRAAGRDRAPHGASGGPDDLAGRRVARHLGIPAEA